MMFTTVTEGNVHHHLQENMHQVEGNRYSVPIKWCGAPSHACTKMMTVNNGGLDQQLQSLEILNWKFQENMRFLRSAPSAILPTRNLAPPLSNLGSSEPPGQVWKPPWPIVSSPSILPHTRMTTLAIHTIYPQSSIPLQQSMTHFPSWPLTQLPSPQVPPFLQHQDGPQMSQFPLQCQPTAFQSQRTMDQQINQTQDPFTYPMGHVHYHNGPFQNPFHSPFFYNDPQSIFRKHDLGEPLLPSATPPVRHQQGQMHPPKSQIAANPDIDEMPKVSANSNARPAKPALTPEEVKIKAQELRYRARKKKEEEEKRMERESEKERIRIGKELLEAKRMEKENERQRLMIMHKAKKEEEKRAREKIRQKLEEDKAERREKLGLPPEDPTTEEFPMVNTGINMGRSLLYQFTMVNTLIKLPPAKPPEPHVSPPVIHSQQMALPPHQSSPPQAAFVSLPPTCGPHLPHFNHSPAPPTSLILIQDTGYTRFEPGDPPPPPSTSLGESFLQDSWMLKIGVDQFMVQPSPIESLHCQFSFVDTLIMPFDPGITICSRNQVEARSEAGFDSFRQLEDKLSLSAGGNDRTVGLT